MANALECIRMTADIRKQRLKSRTLDIYLLFMNAIDNRKGMTPEREPNAQDRGMFVEMCLSKKRLANEIVLAMEVQIQAVLFVPLRAANGEPKQIDPGHFFADLFNTLWEMYFVESFLFNSKQIRTLDAVYDAMVTAFALNTPLTLEQVGIVRVKPPRRPRSNAAPSLVGAPSVRSDSSYHGRVKVMQISD